LEKTRTYDAVVIGTSAGGLNALSFLFEKLPIDYPLPVIVVQHRVKDQKELLEEVLQSRCRIKIKQADEKEKIEGGKVYIAPPNYHLLIESDRTFSLSSDDLVCYSRPSIDVLFETAAEVYGGCLAGIVLTGSNADGANGIVAIRKQGGFTIAQAPADAEFSSMPQAAIDTKCVLRVYALAEIKEFLLTQSSHEK
jgi:two-component system chemotaxis response regulator CheB